jgi:sarcosine oxidase subunit alpha
LAWIVSSKKPEFVGKRSFARPDTRRADRKQLVGLLPLDPDVVIPEGSQLVADPAAPPPVALLGHVTSSYRSAALGRSFALALVRGGRERIGEIVHAPLASPPISAEIVEPVFVDPEGARRDGRPV